MTACARCERPMTYSSIDPGPCVVHDAKGLCEGCYHAANRPKGRWLRCSRLRDVDPIAVERLLAGTFPAGYQPTVGELSAAITSLSAYRMTHKQIAERIGCTTRTVARHLADRQEVTA